MVEDQKIDNNDICSFLRLRIFIKFLRPRQRKPTYSYNDYDVIEVPDVQEVDDRRFLVSKQVERIYLLWKIIHAKRIEIGKRSS